MLCKTAHTITHIEQWILSIFLLFNTLRAGVRYIRSSISA